VVRARVSRLDRIGPPGHLMVDRRGTDLVAIVIDLQVPRPSTKEDVRRESLKSGGAPRSIHGVHRNVDKRPSLEGCRSGT
jgi:hypothetical protein